MSDPKQNDQTDPDELPGGSTPSSDDAEQTPSGGDDDQFQG